MSELTPKANAMLIEYQNYKDDEYEATEDEWADYGRRAVEALYEAERSIASLQAENERLRELLHRARPHIGDEYQRHWPKDGAFDDMLNEIDAFLPKEGE